MVQVTVLFDTNDFFFGLYIYIYKKYVERSRIIEKMLLVFF